VSTEAASSKALAAPGRAEGAVSRVSGRIPELDGLRAIAIWGVLIGHLFFHTPGMLGPLPRWTAPLRVAGDHGWLGVDLFFVLSGFLITGILLDAKGRPGYFQTFYKRRAFRILPIYSIVCIVLIVAYGIHFAPYFAFCALFIANLSGIANLDVPNGAGPYWSLAVEEQFYLGWPLLVLALNRRSLALAAGAMIVIEPWLRLAQAHHDTPAFMLLTWSRSDGLAMGALLAIWFRSRFQSRENTARLVAAMLALVAASFVAGIPFGILSSGEASTAIRISQAVFAFGAILAWSVSRSGSAGTAFLRTRFARYTADLSYCLYLVHVALIDAFGWLVAHLAPSLEAQLSVPAFSCARAAFVLTCAYLIAAFSRRWIELPAIEYAHRRPETQGRNAAVVSV
jgi:peptidoglycan/LPS O-acetylase OafA/YrhL